jgi:hypothetical protein
MISSLLSMHPEVLSLSEAFVYTAPDGLQTERMTGGEFAHLCHSKNLLVNKALRAGMRFDEGVYDFSAPGARWTHETIPPIIHASVPNQSPDPERFDAVHDELEGWLKRQPERSIGDHFRTVFDHLRDRLGRRVWVERTGGSLTWAAKLVKMFPEARFVHVYRDGRDTALSMLQHPVFRLVMAALHDMRADCGKPLLRLQCRSVMQRFGSVPYLLNPGYPLLRKLAHRMERMALRALLETVDLRTFVEDAEVTLAHAGWLWNDMIMRGERVLRGIPGEKRLDVRFEDVQAAPREQLERLIRFIDPSLVDESWLRQASAVPRAARSSYRRLPEAEQQQLTEICRPGLELLGYPC